MPTPLGRIVVTDANVLINLIHVGRLDMCAHLPGYEFIVPDHVRREITDATQLAALDDAAHRAVLRVEPITDPAAISIFTQLTQRLGRGEAACLAIAAQNGWMVASDEKGRFLREAESRIGTAGIIGTKDLFVLAIGAGMLSIEDADADKATLAQRRFTMPFKSFREVISGSGGKVR